MRKAFESVLDLQIDERLGKKWFSSDISQVVSVRNSQASELWQIDLSNAFKAIICFRFEQLQMSHACEVEEIVEKHSRIYQNYAHGSQTIPLLIVTAEMYDGNVEIPETDVQMC